MKRRSLLKWLAALVGIAPAPNLAAEPREIVYGGGRLAGKSADLGEVYHSCGAKVGHWKGGIRPPWPQSSQYVRADGTSPEWGSVFDERCPGCDQPLSFRELWAGGHELARTIK